MTLSKLFTLATFSTVLTLAGCQSMSHSANATTNAPIVTNPTQAVTLPLTNSKLQNYVWQLMTVTDKAGKPILQELFYNANKPLLVTFAKDGKVRLDHTCNKMWADYMLTNDNVVVGGFAGTRMLCEPARMTFDRLAPSVLKGQYKLTQTGDGEPVLTVTHDNQVSVFKPVPKK